MKKFFTLTLLLLCSLTLYAQKDVTKFLGIPVDGTKEEMIRKLMTKGFKCFRLEGQEVLEGEFNGHEVYVGVLTNNNKVYRVVVTDKNSKNESQIKIRYNNLCHQFEKNPKYFTLFDDQSIPDDEQISYEMSVKKKQYQASFFQCPESIDSMALVERVQKYLVSKYTEDQIENLTQEHKEDILNDLYMDIIEENMNKLVWFNISKNMGEYRINLFYDNVYNQANGEDL